MIIQSLVTHSLPRHLKLHQLIKKIKILLSSFLSVQFFHILRDLNGEAYKEVNLVVPLSKGTPMLNGVSHSLNLP